MDNTLNNIRHMFRKILGSSKDPSQILSLWNRTICKIFCLKRSMILLSHCFYYCLFYLVCLCCYLAGTHYWHFTPSWSRRFHRFSNFTARLHRKQCLASSLFDAIQSFDLCMRSCRVLPYLWVSGFWLWFHFVFGMIGGVAFVSEAY